MASETVQTIASQISSFRPRGSQLIAVDETTLRVHAKRGRRVRNVDIAYVPGLDLYTVQVHTFSSPDYEVSTETFEGVYADSLENFFPERVTL